MSTDERQQRIQELFGRAMQEAATERHHWLAEQCGTDKELLKELLQLLDHAAPVDDPLEEGLADDQVRRAFEDRTVLVGSDGVAHELVDVKGKQLGQYSLLQRIGEGGFGYVYLAEDATDRQVAIKVLHERHSERSDVLNQFRQESEILQELQHPALVKYIDMFEAESGEQCLVTEYVSGGTLSQRLDKQEWSTQSIVDFIAVLADALHHLHVNGYTHRDVKPDNILLDESGNPVLADVGIALTDEAYGHGKRHVTGSLAYLSPEQARGDSHLVDGRTDVYSLGVVMYQMLTGRRPFSADNTAELLRRIQEIAIKPPRQINESIPLPLEEICLKATAKDPADRFATAADFAGALRAAAVEFSSNSTATLFSWCLAAVLLLLGGLWAFRGDGHEQSDRASGTDRATDVLQEDIDKDLRTLRAMIGWVRIPPAENGTAHAEFDSSEFLQSSRLRAAETIRNRIRDAQECTLLIARLSDQFEQEARKLMEEFSQPLGEKLRVYELLREELNSEEPANENVVNLNEELGQLARTVNSATQPLLDLIDSRLSGKDVNTPLQVATFDILVSRDDSSFAQLDQMLPLVPGDSIRFSIALNRKAYTKLYWVDAHNQFGEFYPHEPPDGLLRSSEPVAFVESPAKLSQAWTPLDPSGFVESVYLLVSDEPLDNVQLPTDVALPNRDLRLTEVQRYQSVRGEGLQSLHPISNTRSLGHSKADIKDGMRQVIDHLQAQADVIRVIQIPMTPEDSE